MTQFLRDNGKSVDGFYLSHSFGLAKSTKRNNTNITLFLSRIQKMWKTVWEFFMGLIRVGKYFKIFVKRHEQKKLTIIYVLISLKN